MMNIVLDLAREPEKIDGLLVDLDSIATDVDHYEYGLPLYTEEVKARMREAVMRWLASLAT